MPLASYRLYIIISVSVAKYCLWSRPVSGWVGGEGFVRCPSSLGCALGRVRVCGWGERSVSRLATKTPKPGSGAGWGGGCAVRPLLVGSLEEGLTMPLPIVLFAFGGECKS